MTVYLKENLFVTDNVFINSFINEIENVMDLELKKPIDEMNTELIDDCVCAIDFLQSTIVENTGKEIIYCAPEVIIKLFKKRRKFLIASTITCAAILILCVGTMIRILPQNVNYGFVSDGMFSGLVSVFKNEEITEKETHLSELYNDDKTTQYIMSEETSATVVGNVSESILSELRGINIDFPDNMKIEYKSIDEIDFSELMVTLLYSNGEKNEIPINQCTVDIGNPDKNGKTIINVSYEDKSTMFFVVVQTEQEKNPVTLNSIYGIFTEGYSVEYMEIIAVYSDGSEKTIPKSDCNITTQYSSDFEADMVVVEYNGCSFSFLPQ